MTYTDLIQPPLDTPVLIYAPNTLGPRWLFAIRANIRGYKLPRWKIYCWMGPTSTNVAHRDFQPDEWLPLEYTVN